MTLKVTYSALARKDLENIRNWTRDNFGAEQSKTYIRQIAASLQMIAENPGLARDAFDIRADLKKLVTNRHVAYFKVKDTSIAVVRILHGKMDADRWV
jgi:toxin ParE1/3/4